jgi:FAD/FMN-containing dehydrogenase
MALVTNTTLEHIDPITVTQLQHRMQGEVLTPATPGYQAARRVLNRRIDQFPALIARCHTAEDVAAALAFAQNQNLEISIRSGGHSVAGHSVGEDGMLIDLSQMRQITVDPLQRIAFVQPGASNGELVSAAAAYGLATTTGTCATVGMGGSTLGGGIGWLMGRFGATVDNLLAAEVVTAEGRILNTSADQHPDLFWAIRGGGGNFGIVTTFTYQLHQLGPVLGGPLIFPMAAAELALRMYRELSSSAPNELLTHAVLATIPDFGPAVILQPVYSGEDLTIGEQLLASVRQSGVVALDLIARRSYAETYMMLTPPIPPGAAWHDTAYALHNPSDAALDALIACADRRPAPLPVVNIHQIHGVATRVASDATAFALREPHYSVTNIGMWLDGDGKAEITWAEQSKAAMASHASKSLYVNFLGDEGDAAIRAAYRGNYERLARIKAQYDPTNLFHRNQNIRPL